MISRSVSGSEGCMVLYDCDRAQGVLFMNRLVLLTAALVLLGCSSEIGEAPAPGPDVDPVPIGGDAGTLCAHPEEGCPCAQETPLDCYLDPVVVDGVTTCRRGSRYCRADLWTACESVHEYELRVGPGIAPLVTGPSTCNACDPACAVSRDVPSDTDLPGSSTSVEYNPAQGGIQLETSTDPPPPLPDADGDGIPDIADDCDGPGAFLAADGTCYGDTFFYHTLPFGGPPEIDPLDINVQVRTADIYFLMDTTGSMGGEISNLKASLTSGSYIAGCGGGIIGAIQCVIPDAWFGVGRYDDYPYGSYGGAPDVVYAHLQDISTSVAGAQAAVNTMFASGGWDGPESQTQALWAVATGGGLGSYLSARTGCAAGTWGYPCFRDGTIPVIIHFTDAPMHNGPFTSYDYSFTGGGAIPLPSTTAVGGNGTRGSAERTGDAATTWQGFTGNSCGFANNYTAGCGWGTDTSRDVVFRFDVSTTAPITITTDGSSTAYDTILSLRNSAFTEIACNDDNSTTYAFHSRITATLTPGTYYVVIEGYAGSCGDYRLSIGNPTAMAPPPPTGFPVTWAESVAAINAAGLRVITVHSGGTYGIDDANALADATSSYSSSGTRYVFPISSAGTGLSSAVVDAVVDLANYNRMDIGARAVDNPATALDETGFVDAITAVGWGPGSCTGTSGGSTFLQCLPGTTVDFAVSFRNDIVMPTAVPQVFDFFIEVVGDGTFVLERIPVRIVVPPAAPLYPPTGEYWRDYDSTLYCADNERPDWGELAWVTVDMPPDTSIRWEIRAASTLADLPGTTPVTFTTAPAISPIDIGGRLVAAGIPNYLPYVRVTSVLIANPDRSATPVLRSFELRYTCVPTE